jgi:hypothetical protein
MNDVLKKHGPLGFAVLVLAGVILWQQRTIESMLANANDARNTQAAIIVEAIADNCKPKGK